MPFEKIKTLEPAAKRPGAETTPCAACGVRNMSICGSLDDTDIPALAAIISSTAHEPHDGVMDEGEPADYLFNVTSGAVKLYKLLPDGRRQITGFLFQGDFLGIAMNDTYAYSAEAITKLTLCRFPRRKLEGLMDQFPQLEQRLLRMASNELVQAQDQMLLLGRKTAKEKVCSFLLGLYRRRAAREGADALVPVQMSRADIGDYLGLTTETVSRTFTALKSAGAIRLREGGMVEIPDRDALEALAEGA